MPFLQYLVILYSLSVFAYPTTIWKSCLKIIILVEICMQARKQQLELDMEQQTGSK